MIPTLLAQGEGEWLRGEGPESDVVMSTRIRLARNVQGYRFSTRIEVGESQELLGFLREKILSLPDRNFLWADLRDLGPIERQVLVERHLISREHASGQGPRGVAVEPGERLGIMVLEEDHLRLQVLLSGLDVEKAWKEMSALSSALAERIPFAWDERFGFLTACPTNVGTGLRVSAMLHLPGLVISRQIEKATQTAQKIHMAVRGLYGEGSRPASDLFQVSNQVTLGRTEADICAEFQEVVEKIVAWERETRNQLLAERRTELEDQASRSMGILERARTMTSEEALQHLSRLRLGIHLGLVENLSLAKLNRIFLWVQPGHLQKEAGKALDPQERDILRAEKLRELMP